jgi:hypothetical protein
MDVGVNDFQKYTIGATPAVMDRAWATAMSPIPRQGML